MDHERDELRIHGMMFPAPLGSTAQLYAHVRCHAVSAKTRSRSFLGLGVLGVDLETEHKQEIASTQKVQSGRNETLTKKYI